MNLDDVGISHSSMHCTIINHFPNQINECEIHAKIISNSLVWQAYYNFNHLHWISVHFVIPPMFCQMNHQPTCSISFHSASNIYTFDINLINSRTNSMNLTESNFCCIENMSMYAELHKHSLTHAMRQKDSEIRTSIMVLTHTKSTSAATSRLRVFAYFLQ